jgi:hypothetical protein
MRTMRALRGLEEEGELSQGNEGIDIDIDIFVQDRIRMYP